MSSSSPYVYQKFENAREQIRLLIVSPNRDPNSVVEAKLSIYNIPSSNELRPYLRLPFYCAVSYVWGTGDALKQTERILLDGCSFPVTSNVYKGLREARISASGLPIALWFDTICIDQSNDAEKAQQIPLMREIYYLSATTFIHVPGGPEDLKLMRFINDLNKPPFLNKINGWFTSSYTTEKGQQEGLYAWLQGLIVGKMSEILLKPILDLLLKPSTLFKVRKNRRRDDQDYQERSKASRSESDCKCIQELETWEPSKACLQAIQSADLAAMAQRIQDTFGSQTQYFHRMWTFQEAVVNPIAVVHTASADVSLKAFVRTVHYLHRTQGLDQKFVDTITTLWIVRNNWYWGFRPSLRELLFNCRYRDCVDPKDKVFGLLGFIRDRTDPRLLPDNTLSVAQVYANATKYIASSEGYLDVICVRGKEESPEGLPSWTPNFHHFGAAEDGRKKLVDASGQAKIFHASSTEPYMDLGLTAQQIEVLDTKGLCLGVIEDISPLPDTTMEPIWTWIVTTGKDSEPEEQKLRSGFSRLLSLLSQLQQVSNSTEKSEFWTNMENEIQQLSKAPYQEEQIDFFLSLVCGQIKQGTICDADEAAEIIQNACVRNPDGDDALSLLCNAIQTGVHSRRLAVLDGGLVSTVPEDTMLGDTVCVLIGCGVPVCLRKDLDSDNWTLVGECYVPGYMNGEAIEERDSGELTECAYSLI